MVIRYGDSSINNSRSENSLERRWLLAKVTLLTAMLNNDTKHDIRVKDLRSLLSYYFSLASK